MATVSTHGFYIYDETAEKFNLLVCGEESDFVRVQISYPDSYDQDTNNVRHVFITKNKKLYSSKGLSNEEMVRTLTHHNIDEPNYSVTLWGTRDYGHHTLLPKKYPYDKCDCFDCSTSNIPMI